MSDHSLRSIRTDLEVYVTFPRARGVLTKVLTTVRAAGGALHGHLFHEYEDRVIASFLCDRPTEAALALQERGLKPETRTVVVVRTEQDVGALGHLVATLEREGVRLIYTYSTGGDPAVLIVLRTDDNPGAEDALRSYLLRTDPGAATEYEDE